MGRRGPLVEFRNLKIVVYDYIEGKDEFYLSEKMVEDIFKKYQEQVLSRSMCLKIKAAQHMKFRRIKDRGQIYLRKQISKIINYTKDFNCKKRRNGGAAFYERITY